VHRDVKPGNLLVRPDGVVKVTDFGIARATDAAPLTRTGLLVGTAAYLSPEQAGGKSVTPASDIYSLGVVAYECLAGRRPFDADSPMAVAMSHINDPPPPLPGDVPPLLSDFVMRALDKDPARRQPSAGDFGRTALALAAQLRSGTAPTVVTEQPTRAAAAPAATKVEPLPAHDGADPTAPDGAGPDPDAERRRIRNIFIAIGVAVVLLGFLLLRACAGGTSTAVVPDVTGKPFARAAAALEARGFDVRRHDVDSRTAAKGQVLRQSAPAGERLPTDRRITLTVSSGPATVTLHAADYVGRPYDEVAAALTDEHLEVVRIDSPDKAAAGTVTAIDPVGSVKEGSTVTVTVAATPTEPTKTPKGHKPPKHHDD
jgi:eukaryotic-like serine/threonine-protein kinase